MQCQPGKGNLPGSNNGCKASSWLSLCYNQFTCFPKQRHRLLMDHHKPDTAKKNSAARQSIKVIVEKHLDGYVAYPLGIEGAVVGEGDTYEEALTDVESAIRAHIE